MGKATGFKEYQRENFQKRPIEERIQDYKEVEKPLSQEQVEVQAARCMDCGVPFCSSNYGCPLGNIIPEWNDMVYKGQWKRALELLHETNNFPEFTGKVCPALCETACVLGIHEPAVTIRQMELAIIEKGFEEGWVTPQPPKMKTDKKVAVVGSGPAGLACAQQLTRAGHSVTVFERADQIGGLLVYGIPDFKLDKNVVARRVNQMVQEGVEFKTNSNVGENISVAQLQEEYDVIVLTGGSTQARDLPVPGRDLDGIHFAMDFLTQQNRRVKGLAIEGKELTAAGKNVIVIGGGDTGSDCIGTSVRQGAKSITQLELLPKPPVSRTEKMPWPTYPFILKTSSSHEEGGDRQWSVKTTAFTGENGVVKKLQGIRLDENLNEIPGSEFELDADLVLFAMGFLHPEHKGMLEDLGVELDQRGNVKTDENYMTSAPGVFAAGDMRRGQSLVVWAISEGRKAAKAVDEYLMGSTHLK